MAGWSVDNFDIRKLRPRFLPPSVGPERLGAEIKAIMQA